MKCVPNCHHGTCLRCEKPWCEVHPHMTPYPDGGGMSPLCQECWKALTPLNRLPFYHVQLERHILTGKPPELAARQLGFLALAIKAGL